MSAGSVARGIGILVGVAVLLAVLWVGSVSLRIWYDARGQDLTPTDGIVVLGAAQYDGTPSPVFEQRLRKAQELWLEGVAPVIITTGGGQEGDRVTEAEAGQTFLVSAGVPADSTIALPLGNDTEQSLAAVADLYDERGWTSATLVTDPWHTFRSKKIADDYGIEAHSAPVESGPVVESRTTEVRYIVRETGAYISWVLFGETEIHGPDATRS